MSCDPRKDMTEEEMAAASAKVDRRAPGRPFTEAVNHPSHYGGDVPYESIKVINAWGLNFNLGNAVKYISRAGKKDPAKLIEDLEKARFYLDDEIKQLKGNGQRK